MSHFGETGTEAGQLSASFGVTANAAGDLYVGELGNHRISEFESSGEFLSAFGWGVLNGAQELQACTTECTVGMGGELEAGSGEIDIPLGIAVNGSGDLYVVDFGHYRVQEFGPKGEFILTFGGEVDKTTHANVCTAASGDTCGRGVPGTANGQFEGEYESNEIAVAPNGRVYVGEMGRVQVFEPSGTWRETISLAGLSSTAPVMALAADGAGDVFVKIGRSYEAGKVSGVREIEPGGIVRSVQFDEGSESIGSIALDAAGDLFVGDTADGFHIAKYDISSGQELSAFGFDTLSEAKDIAFSSATGDVYVTTGENQVWAYSQPEAGPLVEPGRESATPEPRGAVKFQATVNPEGNSTTYHVEYVDQAHYQQSGFASAVSTPAASIGEGLFEDHGVTVTLPEGALTAGVTYHWRFVATDTAAHTSTGPDESFEEVPPALLDGPWASNVAGTSVTLAARIDPLGSSTTYSLEYGTSTAYGHALTGSVGEGAGYVEIGYHLQNLDSVTEYHYRVVTTNAFGTVVGADHTFRTQSAGGELELPDGRAWQLVSPADKHGAMIEAQGNQAVQAAADGSAVTYVVNEPLVEHPPASVGFSMVRSVHGADGWSSTEFGISPKLPDGPTYELLQGQELAEPLRLSPDLSLAMIEPAIEDQQPLSPEATERTPYLRNNTTEAYLPLVTPADVPAGVKFGGIGSGDLAYETQVHFFGSSADLRHVVLASASALAPGANSKPCHEGHEGSVCDAVNNLYEWNASGGPLKQVNVLPDGKPLQFPPLVDADEYGAFLGGGNFNVAHAVSNDGRRIVWSVGESRIPKFYRLYVRDMIAGKTLQVGGSHSPVFQTMNADGSRVLFTEGGELYEFDFETDTTTDLTASHLAGEPNAGVAGLMGTSEDGSYVYLVAAGDLSGNENAMGEKAEAGNGNLYVLHEESGRRTTSYIAALSSEDFRDLNSRTIFHISPDTSYVSPDGRYAAFMSNRPLTGYDNIDANSPPGEAHHDAEVYLYDAAGSGRLMCASCNPSGARPAGMLDQEPLIDRNRNWSGSWVASIVPGWNKIGATGGLSGVFEQPRYLSDSGRLFFDSVDALAPQDVNGLADVYEYEPAGVGDCTSGSVSFSERSGGCVRLLSTGTSSGESAFMAASENGDDAFLLTASKLAGEDYDASYDLYDAHVCGIGWSCVAPVISPPPCASGDSCKGAPALQPEIFGPAPSATFSGTGNVIPGKGAAKPRKKKTRHKFPKARHKRHVRKAKHRRGRKAARPAARSASGKGGR